MDEVKSYKTAGAFRAALETHPLRKTQQEKMAEAVRATFTKRGTHAVPAELDPPPAKWEPVFDALANKCGFAMRMEEGFAMVRGFGQTLGARRRNEIVWPPILRSQVVRKRRKA